MHDRFALSLPVAACDGDEMEGIDYGGKTDRKPGWAVRVMCQGPSTKNVRTELEGVAQNQTNSKGEGGPNSDRGKGQKCQKPFRTRTFFM